MIPALLAGCRMVVDFGDPGGIATDSAGPPDPGAVVTLVGGAGDGAGEGGLWWVPPGDGGALRLAVGMPRRGAIALVEVEGLAPGAPLSAGTELYGEAEAEVGAAFAVADRALAVGAPGEQEVWLVARDVAGRIEAEEDHLAAAGGEDSDSESGRFGAAVAAGDVDGDGLDDLAIGAPSGDGLVVLAPVDEILRAGRWDPELAPVRIRGQGGGLGAGLAAGDLDGSGRAALVACAPDDLGGGGRCWVVPGGIEAEDQEVGEVATASIAGGGVGRVGPRIGDVDGDGRPELVLAGAEATWIFRDPAGALAPDDAAAQIAGAAGALGLGATRVFLGLPADDAVYAVDSPAGARTLPADAEQAFLGAPGTSFGAAVSDVAELRLAIAAPGAGGGAGEVLLFDLDLAP